MCQEQYNTKNKKFKQLTYKDRVKIETLYNDQHLNYTEIGEILGKHRTTISRDIKQGLVKNLTTDLIEIYVYSAEVAQKKNEENETAKGTNLKIGNDMRLAEFIEKEIKEEKSSPEVIAYKVKNGKFSTTLCFKTIYNYILKQKNLSPKIRLSIWHNILGISSLKKEYNYKGLNKKGLYVDEE